MTDSLCEARCHSVAPDEATECERDHGHGGRHQHGDLYWDSPALRTARPLKDIKGTGAAWITEEELAQLVEVAEAAQAFVRTTSVFRQQKASRDDFERMALALIEVGAWKE